MKKSVTLSAALAALLVPAVLAAQDNPAAPQPPAPSEGQPAVAPAAAPAPAPAPAVAPSPAPAPAQAVQQDAKAVVGDEKKTEQDELKLLDDQEKADVAGIQAKNLGADEEARQAKAVRVEYARKKAAVKRKYRAEEKKDSQDALKKG